MIAYLKGKIIHKREAFLILEVSGVGYKVFCTPEVLGHDMGSVIEVFTYHKSTDQEQALYGMPDVKSLEFFELLLTVTGIGPKGALTIISSAKLDVLQNAIANQDLALFTKMGGVGKKTAERIILELKNKVGVLESGSGSGGTEIFDALTSLGYNQREIKTILESMPAGMTLQEQIKWSLQHIGK